MGVADPLEGHFAAHVRHDDAVTAAADLGPAVDHVAAGEEHQLAAATGGKLGDGSVDRQRIVGAVKPDVGARAIGRQRIGGGDPTQRTAAGQVGCRRQRHKPQRRQTAKDNSHSVSHLNSISISISVICNYTIITTTAALLFSICKPAVAALWPDQV